MRVFFAVLMLAGVCSGAPAGEFHARRDALRAAVKDGVIVLFGHSLADADESRIGFFQEPNFDYLTGWTEPGAAVLLTPSGGETLFLPKRDPAAERWTGRKIGPDDAGIHDLTGFSSVLPIELFEREFQKAIETAPKVYTLADLPLTARLKSLAPLREFADISPAIAKLRMKKSAWEIQQIQRSIDVSIDGLRAAWRRTAPGVYEYQIAAQLLSAYLDHGCGRPAYPPIIGSGPNSTVLHYSANSRRMDGGDIVVMDAAAECTGYAADITRTIPVSGTFSSRQREIYEIVLGAQQAAIAAVKPGMLLAGRDTPNSLYKIAYDYINTHGKDKNGNSLGRYFIHGLGHHVGLDVHDAWIPGTPLGPGMVITIEPGIYIPEEAIGVRIEDMVLVTETGGKLLTSALPSDPDAVTRALTALRASEGGVK